MVGFFVFVYLSFALVSSYLRFPDFGFNQGVSRRVVNCSFLFRQMELKKKERQKMSQWNRITIRIKKKTSMVSHTRISANFSKKLTENA